MKLAFNELCKEDISRDPNDFVHEFINVLKNIYDSTNEKVNIIPSDDFWEINGFHIFDYVNDRDEKGFLLRQIDKAQSEEICIEDAMFRYAERIANGFSISAIYNIMAISLYTSERWNTDMVNVSMLDGGNKDIRHISTKKHWLKHLSYYNSEQYQKSQLLDIKMLEKHGNTVLENIVFGDNALDWIKDGGGSKTNIKITIDDLYELNRFLKGNSINLSELRNCSSESQSTINQYGDERKFRFCGQLKLCLWHLKPNSNIRIHFCVDWQERKAYVGYIGKHLKTSKYK